MFVSASGDWTLRLWHEGHENALLLFQSSNQEVNDVQWCPTNATVFADVTSGGRLEVRQGAVQLQAGVVSMGGSGVGGWR